MTAAAPAAARPPAAPPPPAPARAASAHDLRWLRAFVGFYLEVEAGLRPARHLRRYIALDLVERLGGCGRPGPLASVVRIRAQRRGPRCEAVVLLRRGDRIGALVLALREQADGWRVVEIGRPEGPAPTPLETAAVAVLPSVDADDIDDDLDRTPWPRWTLPDGWRRAAA